MCIRDSLYPSRQRILYDRGGDRTRRFGRGEKAEYRDVYKRQFLGYVGARELRALDVLEEVLDDPMWDEEQKEMIRESVNGGHLQCLSLIHI